MTEPGVIVARTADEVREAYIALVPRQNGCLKCMDSAPTCPENCASEGKVCQFTVSLDCTKCAESICVAPDPSTTTSSSSGSNGSRPNIGAIAGGVAAGVVLIAVATYLVWKFFVQTKRQQISQQVPDDDFDSKADIEKEVRARRDQRSSTHTVHSIASTVLTRASNIIQIAYIPGVTNRATPTSPTLLVPPVPPIPMAVSSSNSPSPYEDQHFFVPGDLRDSTYSALSTYTDRTSIARTSFAPRSSIASTIYGGKNAVIAPAVAGVRAKPAVISVKSTGAASGSSGSRTPPVPSVDYEKYGRPKSRDSTFSVGSTFVKNASAATATQARAQVIRVGSNGSKQADPANSVSPSATANTATSLNPEPSIANGLGTVDTGPFSDSLEIRSKQSTTSLGAVIEETPRQAPHPRTHSTAIDMSDREGSPFSDAHATLD